MIEEDPIMIFEADSLESIQGLSMRDISIMPHIHNTKGRCLKNRYGVRCD